MFSLLARIWRISDNCAAISGRSQRLDIYSRFHLHFQLNEIGFSDDVPSSRRSGPLPTYIEGEIAEEKGTMVVNVAVRSICVKQASGSIRLFNGGECLKIGKQTDIVQVRYHGLL